MKRVIALILSLAVLMALLLPMQAFAEEKDKGLENAIKIAKSKFTIPDTYKFTYSIGSEGDKTVWYLNWNSKDGMESISVTIDSSGKIRGYDKYRPYDYSRPKKLPKVSKQEAKEKAEEFIKNIDPDILPQLKYQEDEQNYLVDYAYYFTFNRVVNGIVFYGNYASMRVDSDTGEVIGYYLYWDENINFPAPEGIISLEQAEKAYREKLGLRLVYTYRMEGEKMVVSAIYAPKYNNYYYGVDAFTGERVQIDSVYYGPYYDVGGSANMLKDQTAEAAGEPVLTPEELEAVREASKLIDVAKAEQIARSNPYLELDNSFKLTYSSLSTNWPNRNEFSWYLSFSKETGDKVEDYRYVSVGLDAKTGEITNFYKTLPYKEGETAKYDQNASKAEVEKFLKEFKADKFAQTQYVDWQGAYIREPSNWYAFSYERMVNGVPFQENGITVEFDAVHGKVRSFNMSWYNLEFPPVDNVVSLNSVYTKLFDQVGLELQYKIMYGEIIPLEAAADGNRRNLNTYLVYALKQGKPYNFDAYTGVLIGYDGKPYKENKVPEYTDIAGHFAEEKIKILAEYGIALEGPEFKPNEKITQKDFFMLLSKVVNTYYGPVITAESSDEDIDQMYSLLIREGIVKEGEKAPNSSVTREDSVKFVIRALKYDKVADIKGIFNITFKDANEIDSNLLGYVAIANGLGIVNGSNGYFYPKKELTRAEAIVIIYNYLQG